MKQAYALESCVKRWLRSFTRNSADIMELTQETYLRLSRVDGARIPSSTKVPAYVKTTTFRVALDWKKRQRKSPVDFISDDEMGTRCDFSARPDDAVAASQELERVARAFNRLTERQRRIFDLHRIEDRTFDEIAIQLHISAVTARRDFAAALLELDVARESGGRSR